MTGLYWKSATEPQATTLLLGERERCLNGIAEQIQTLPEPPSGEKCAENARLPGDEFFLPGRVRPAVVIVVFDMEKADWRDCALIIAGHGSTLNPDSSGPTHQHARTIRELGLFAGVHVCFWKEEPGFRQVWNMIDAPQVYVVPNFISEGYFTQTVIPRELGLAGTLTQRAGLWVKYCDPVGNHVNMTGLLLQRAGEVAPGIDPQEISLVIVGHGTGLNENSARAVRDQVERIRRLGLYGEVVDAFMEETPAVAEWDQLTTCPHVVVVPFFIADGLHSYEDIPVLLGIATETGTAFSQQKGHSDVFLRNPYTARGRQLYYASAIGTSPLLAGVIIDQVRAFDATHGALVE